MSLDPNFSVSQSLGQPNIITLTDTSVGSYGAVVGRKITITKTDGSYLLNNSSWALSEPSIDEDVMNRDYALSVTVDWVNVGGTVLYTKNYKIAFLAYTTNFLNELTQSETSLPIIVVTDDYWNNKELLINLKNQAEQAVAMGNDYVKSQTFLNLAYDMIANKNRFF